MELAIDALEMSRTADHLVIFSGDGNFTSLVAGIATQGLQGLGGVDQGDAKANDFRRTAAKPITLLGWTGSGGR